MEGEGTTKKYRIRLTNGRVIGPLEKEQIQESFDRKHINGDEDCQLFPHGEWLPLKNFLELRDIFQVEKSENSDANGDADGADNADDGDENLGGETLILSEIGKYKKFIINSDTPAKKNKSHLKTDIKPTPGEDFPLTGAKETKNSESFSDGVTSKTESEYIKNALGQKEEAIQSSSNGEGNTVSEVIPKINTDDFIEFKYKRGGMRKTEVGSSTSEMKIKNITEKDLEVNDKGKKITQNEEESKSNQFIPLEEKSENIEEEIAPTRMINTKDLDEKTRVIPEAAAAQKSLREKLEKEKEEREKELQKAIKEKEDAQKKKEAEEVKEEIDPDSKTQMISLDQVISGKEIKNIEEQFINECAKKISGQINSSPESNANAEHVANAENIPNNGEDSSKKTAEETQSKTQERKQKIKKGMKPIVAFAFIIVIYFLYFDDDNKKINFEPTNPTISYPRELVKIDEKKSDDSYKQGMEAYQGYKYSDKLSAARSFSDSMKFKRNNEALGMLILTYAELLPHVVNTDSQFFGDVSTEQDKKNSKKGSKSKNNQKKKDGSKEGGDIIVNYSLTGNALKEKAGNVIFTLIKEGKVKSLTDINMVIGTALFYAEFNKHSAALNVLKQFERISKSLNKKITVKYLTTYMTIAMKLNYKEEVKKIVSILEPLKDKSLDTYLVLTEYAISNNEFEKAEKLAYEGNLKFNKNSVALLLEYAKVLLCREKYEALVKVLQIIEELGFENSSFYYSKFLEYSGIYAAVTKKYEEAVVLLKKSLSLNESIELRSRLATLEVTKGGNTVNGLILESKIWELINKGKEARKDYKWEEAFKYAIDAADLSETNIYARLFLAQIQTERGHFSEAINTLTQLRSNFPALKAIDFALVKTYADAFRFDDAKDIMGNLAQTELKEMAVFSSSMGYIYYKSGKLMEAIKWLLDSVAANPLNDNDYYLLSKIYYKFNKFDQAKTMLLKAMELDPYNVEYMILYAKILYDKESVEMAIGYLSTIIKDNEGPGNVAGGSGTSGGSTASAANAASGGSPAEGRPEVKADEKLPVMPIEEYSKLLSEIAIYYHRSGQLKQYSYFREKLEKLPKQDRSLYDFLIEVAKLEDKDQDFINYSYKLLQIVPGDLNARMALGEVLIQNNKLDEALKVFSEVEQRLNSYPKVHYYISKIHLLKNNLKDAKINAEKEVKINPELEFGYLLQAEIALKEENYLDATNYYKTAQSINQNSVDALMGMAWISFNKNNIDSALDLYSKAAKIEPNNAIARRQLGYVYKALGQGSLAVESFKMYLQMAPDAKDRGEIQTLIKQLE